MHEFIGCKTFRGYCYVFSLVCKYICVLVCLCVYRCGGMKLGGVA